MYAFEKYDKIIFHQLFDICIPEANNGEISDEKRKLFDTIEFHLVNCSCKPEDTHFMNQCMTQKIAFTSQLLAVKTWCYIHQDKNLEQVSGTKNADGKYDENDENAVFNVHMSHEAVTFISMSVNK